MMGQADPGKSESALGDRGHCTIRPPHSRVESNRHASRSRRARLPCLPPVRFRKPKPSGLNDGVENEVVSSVLNFRFGRLRRRGFGPGSERTKGCLQGICSEILRQRPARAHGHQTMSASAEGQTVSWLQGCRGQALMPSDSAAHTRH
jgi:hypothetical protein